MVPSSLADARRFVSGLQATLFTESVWPVRVSNSLPVAASHSFVVLSSLPSRQAYIRAPGHAFNTSVVVAQGQQFLAGDGVPHLGPVVVAPRRQPLAVQAPGHARNGEAV